MKKALLLAAAALVAMAAKAETLAVVFGGYDYTGSATTVVNFADGSATTSIDFEELDLPGIGNIQFCYNGAGSSIFSYVYPAAKGVMWAKNSMIYLTVKQKDVTVTKLTANCAASNPPVRFDVWTSGSVAVDGNTMTWTGSCTDDLMVNNEGGAPVLVNYFEIEYTDPNAVPEVPATPTMAVVFGGYDYTGSATTVVNFADGSATTSIDFEELDLPGIGNIQFCYNGAGSSIFSYVDPAAKGVMWAKNSMIYLTVKQKDVTVTKLTANCAASNPPVRFDVWTSGAVAVDGNAMTWIGSCTDDLMVNNEGGVPVLVNYFEIEYTGANSGVEELEIKNEAAPAVYYNLSGQKIENPAKGGIYIRVEGGKAEKIVK